MKNGPQNGCSKNRDRIVNVYKAQESIPPAYVPGGPVRQEYQMKYQLFNM